MTWLPSIYDVTRNGACGFQPKQQQNFSVIRAHQHAAGSKKKNPAAEALGSSQGGFSSKVHLRAEGQGQLMTRYEKKADNDQAMRLIAASLPWLHFANTPRTPGAMGGQAARQVCRVVSEPP